MYTRWIKHLYLYLSPHYFFIIFIIINFMPVIVNVGILWNPGTMKSSFIKSVTVIWLFKMKIYIGGLIWRWHQVGQQRPVIIRWLSSISRLVFLHPPAPDSEIYIVIQNNSPKFSPLYSILCGFIIKFMHILAHESRCVVFSCSV